MHSYIQFLICCREYFLTKIIPKNHWVTVRVSETEPGESGAFCIKLLERGTVVYTL